MFQRSEGDTSPSFRMAQCTKAGVEAGKIRKKEVRR